MSKDEKLKLMWKDLPSMTKEELMKQLEILHVGASYEDICAQLAETYNDLSVADALFETYPIDDKDSIYPKEFVDEAVTKIAHMENFSFTHYGIISEGLYELHGVMMSDMQRMEKMQDYIHRFFHLCKHFKLDNFDSLVYTIHDDLDMAKEILTYTTLLQKVNTKESHREVVQTVDRFFQIFAQMNPWIEEQLSYQQAASYIALKSSKGEKMFQSMLKEYPDTTEVIYRYGMSFYTIDKKRTKSIFERYRKQMQKDSDFYTEIQKVRF